MLDTIIIFIVSVVATSLSSMSGGGASVINIPVLLWLGVPFPLALATQKVSSAFWVLPASYNFLKGRKVDWQFLILFSLIGLVGVYLGVIVVLNTAQRVMELIIGFLIITLVIYTYFKKDMGLSEHESYSNLRQSFSYFFAFVLGFYESIFGSGNGIMFSMVTFYTKGFDFVDALGYYFSVAFPWVVFAAAMLVGKGYFSIHIMLPTLFGSLIGGYAGSKFARLKGNKFIKMMFVCVGGALGLKLLFGF